MRGACGGGLPALVHDRREGSFMRSPSRCIRRAVAEALESRRLLAAYISNRTLFVDGTSAADTMSLDFEDGRIITRINGVSRSFAETAVDRVSLRALGGADVVRFSESTRPVTLSGGDGNDLFEVVDGSTGYTVLGGAGNDRIESFSSSFNLVFDGGSGTDGFHGGSAGTIDLRRHPNVENATLDDDGTIVGNE